MDFNFFELSNGIKGIHLETKDAVAAHVGFFIHAGSRDEMPNEHGLAHFIEHCIFKGTKKRKAFHILNRMEAVGGELNAYTTKEETCIYTSFLNQHLERAIELMADIMLNATFPEKEIQKEKDVIIDEINSYLDDPIDLIFDDFEGLLYPNHPLGKTILGKKETLKKFNKSHIVNFIGKHYYPQQIFISSTGNFSVKKLTQILEKHIHITNVSNSIIERKTVSQTAIFHAEVKKKTNQTHVVIGSEAYGAKHKMRGPMVLLNNILGGPGMNNRLNMEIREKYGYTYTIESNYTAYSDTGMFSVYFGTDKKSAERTKELVFKELKKMREKALGINQLHIAKQQLIGQIALAQENKVNLMMSMGKSLMLFDTVDTLEEVFRKINKITSKDLLEVANEVLTENKMSSLTFLSK
jgi:predicted Zn-dependent peptidase